MPVLPSVLQITVEQWLLEWDFPYNSVIAAASDLFDRSVDLLTPGEPNVALFGDYDRSIHPEGFLQFGFLGTKDNGECVLSRVSWKLKCIRFSQKVHTLESQAPQMRATPSTWVHYRM